MLQSVQADLWGHSGHMLTYDDDFWRALQENFVVDLLPQTIPLSIQQGDYGTSSTKEKVGYSRLWIMIHLDTLNNHWP